MRLAHVCPRYSPWIGGVETHVKKISERLVKRGSDVEVLTTDPTGGLPKEEVINDVKVRRFKSWAPNEAYYFSTELKKYLTKYSDQYDIVHAHSYHALPALYAAQTKSKNKFIFTPHYQGGGHTFFRNLLYLPYKYIGGKIFEKADKIICVSNYEKKLIIKCFKILDEKIVIIPNGINLEEFRNLKREKNHKLILYVGRLEKYKGIQYIIMALPKLSSDIHLEIIGDGTFRKKLEELTEKLDIKDRVTFHGNIPRQELLKKYAEAGLFVMLSKREAFGISVTEALASGTPCIVADTSALTEWVDGKNCFGIEYPIKIDELVHLISEVKGKVVNPSTLRLPTWDECVKKLITVYEEVLVHV